MSLFATLLNHEVPSFTFTTGQTIKNSSTRPKKQEVKEWIASGDSSKKFGERRRDAILAIVEEWREVTVLTVVDELEKISYRSANDYLNGLAKEGKILRIEPARKGPGQACVFRRIEK